MIRIKIHTILIQILICIFLLNAFEKEDTTDLLLLCPKKGEIEKYQQSGEPEFAIGEDLYLVINGGAEIYHEYGFRKAVFLTYTNSTGNSINLEIYEMVSDAAAFGIYSFKTGKEGKSVKLGHEGWLESYYINFWKGNFLVTLTSLKTDTSCIDELKKLAATVDDNIKCSSTPPSLISYLPQKHLHRESITYLKGNLGLFNQDIFGSKNIFGLFEGVIGEYKNNSIIIIKYDSYSESTKWYTVAKDHFKTDQNYKNFIKHETHFEANELEGNNLWLKQFQNYIIIFYGREISKAHEQFQFIKEKILQ